MTHKKKFYLFVYILFGVLYYGNAQTQNKLIWGFDDDGSISWQVEESQNHTDHIEMSGFHVSAILTYGIENGGLALKYHLVFPMLRTIPNNTHASLAYDFNSKDFPKVKINSNPVNENPEKFSLNGLLSIESKTNEVIVEHTIYPSVDKAAVVERRAYKNITDKKLSIELPEIKEIYTSLEKEGVYGSYVISAQSDKNGTYSLKPGETIEYSIIYSARKACEPAFYVSVDYEFQRRKIFVESTGNDLIFESPNDTLNRAFAFAKIRATESIYDTKGGLMHGPGGGSYYAAIWANDQAEYANPFFPFLGNLAGNESAINSFRHFARYMNPEYKRIPSSIISEGVDFWNGAGDRGDMAMIAYGAGRFALAYGNKETAGGLWPLIEWSLEYCRRQINKEGVVKSDSDELEGRFPAGKANLNTSSLYYDALNSAVMLGSALGVDKSQLQTYKKQAEDMREAIENYFGATLDGFETYRYYKKNTTLRAWICTPLTVGIYDRAEGTIDALFSPSLWTKDGLATEEGDVTFWDRSTLYGLRGAFAAGETERTMKFFNYYSARRLLGEHVPYPVEAYPEGGQQHLSAESALYCRVVTEGIFGIRPVGLSSFMLTPQLYSEWDQMALRNIRAFNRSFDIEVKRSGKNLLVKVLQNGKVIFSEKIKDGGSVKVEF